MEIHKISVGETHKIQLNLLKEIDRFCLDNNIVYYLAFGTLLGAIRHHGYIPWDDDVDIMMPRPEYERFLLQYKSSDKYEVITYKSNKGFFYNFARIINKNTISLLGRNILPGINIDIYPLDGVPSIKKSQNKYINSIYKYINIQNLLIRFVNGLVTRRLWYKETMSFLPLTIVENSFRKKLLSYDYNNSEFVSNLCGNPHPTFLPRASLIKVIRVQFEGIYFNAPEHYDEVLTVWYGNYMQFPPKDQRHPYHCGDYYWK